VNELPVCESALSVAQTFLSAVSQAFQPARTILASPTGMSASRRSLHPMQAGMPALHCYPFQPFTRKDVKTLNFSDHQPSTLDQSTNSLTMTQPKIHFEHIKHYAQRSHKCRCARKEAASVRPFCLHAKVPIQKMIVRPDQKTENEQATCNPQANPKIVKRWIH